MDGMIVPVFIPTIKVIKMRLKLSFADVWMGLIMDGMTDIIGSVRVISQAIARDIVLPTVQDIPEPTTPCPVIKQRVYITMETRRYIRYATP
jgi:hypothetical protein